MAGSTSIYSPRRAWALAMVSFAGFWIVAAVVGQLVEIAPIQVAFSIGDIPSERSEQLLWYGLVTMLFAVVVCGYWFIWPIGTRTFGRQLHRGWAIGFGIVWGLSEAVLYVAMWSVVREFIASDWLVVAVSFLVIATFTGTWHQFFWDIYVAPIHNIPEWNLRKVLFVHTPNLVLSLSLLTLFGSGSIVVAAQVVALVGSSIFMRFPAPTDEDTLMDGSPVVPIEAS